MIVLVSRLSASAAEIVAGALKNHERAIIVGDKSTFGKGSVQMVYHLANFDKSHKSAAKITIQKWYQPNGESIQLKGIHSEIVLPSTLEHLDLGEDKRENALGWDEIDPASIRAGYGYGMGENGSKLLSALSEKSEKRRENLDEFKFLNERIGWFKARVEKKDWSLNLDAREAFAVKMNERQKELAKSNFKKDEILLDSAIAKKKLQEESSAAQGSPENGAEEKHSQGENAGVKAGSGEKSENLSSDGKPSSEKQASKDKPKKDDVPEFDVSMREALRIMGDWLEIENSAKKN